MLNCNIILIIKNENSENIRFDCTHSCIRCHSWYASSLYFTLIYKSNLCSVAIYASLIDWENCNGGSNSVNTLKTTQAVYSNLSVFLLVLKQL